MDLLDKLEAGLDGFGLMRGDFAIPKRLLFGGLLGAFVISYIKPESMFYEGVPRPWSMLVSEEDSEIPPTTTPWFVVAIGGALILGMFV